MSNIILLTNTVPECLNALPCASYCDFSCCTFYFPWPSFKPRSSVPAQPASRELMRIVCAHYLCVLLPIVSSHCARTRQTAVCGDRNRDMLVANTPSHGSFYTAADHTLSYTAMSTNTAAAAGSAKRKPASAQTLRIAQAAKARVSCDTAHRTIRLTGNLLKLASRIINDDNFFTIARYSLLLTAHLLPQLPNSIDRRHSSSLSLLSALFRHSANLAVVSLSLVSDL